MAKKQTKESRSIAALREQVVLLRHRNENQGMALGTMHLRVAALNERTSTLSSTIKTNEAEIAKLNTSLELAKVDGAEWHRKCADQQLRITELEQLIVKLAARVVAKD